MQVGSRQVIILERTRRGTRFVGYTRRRDSRQSQATGKQRPRVRIFVVATHKLSLIICRPSDSNPSNSRVFQRHLLRRRGSVVFLQSMIVTSRSIYIMYAHTHLQLRARERTRARTRTHGTHAHTPPRTVVSAHTHYAHVTLTYELTQARTDIHRRCLITAAVAAARRIEYIRVRYILHRPYCRSSNLFRAPAVRVCLHCSVICLPSHKQH